MKSFGRTLVILFLIAALGASFGIGWGFGKSQGRTIVVQGADNIALGQPSAVDFSLFWEAWQKVQEKYADREDIDYQAMLYGAIEGMVRSLGDPYSVFMNPQDTKKFLEDVSGTFEGVGMEIGIRDNQLKVIAPLQGTPAQRAGLRAGDRILKVDETSSEGMSVEKAVSLIRGPRGSVVTLTVFREGWDASREFDIERAVIQVPSLKWEMKEGGIAHIQLFQFSQKASRDFRNAAAEIIASSAQGIVLDLRNNPGGFLEVSQDIAGWFLESGQAVVIEDFGPGQEQQVYKAEGNGAFATFPVVVLLNEGSASASEILAGALRDNRGVQIVGKTSFGKGSVQELEHFRDESSLKITVARWLTPNGTLIAEKGLTPDMEVDMTEEDFNQERDPQLDKALEVIKEL